MKSSTRTMERAENSGGFLKFMVILVLLAVIISAIVVMLSHAERRHGAEFVATVSSKCNENNYSMHFYRESDNRHAYLCFLEGLGFVFTIKNFDPAQIEKWKSDVVTAFDRPGAKSFQDAFDYITCTKLGVPVSPCGVRGGPYVPVP